MFKLLLSLLLITPTMSLAAVSEPDRATMAPRNVLLNPGAENGKVTWAVSTGSFTASTSTPLAGNASFVWDATASTQTLSTATTTPEWLKGQNAVASCQVRCASGTCTHTFQPLVGGVAASTTTITSSTTGSPRVTANFIAPTSGAIGLQFVANADEPSLKIDGCIITRADEWNISQVSQASLYGTLTYPATTSCAWNTTSGSFADFSADADCTASPTVSGGISAPATKIPAARALNLPAGNYMVVANGEIGTTGGVADYRGIRIYDGTTAGAHVTANTSGSGGSFLSSIVAYFNYTTAQSSVTFSIQGYSSSGSNIRIQNDGTPLTFTVYRFPSSSEIAARVDTVANSWNGFHDSTCSWARTNTAYGDPTADATCTLTERKNRNFGTVTSYLSGSDKLPGIVFTPVRSGFYWICTRFGSINGSTGALGYRLTDGTNVIFELNDSSQTTYKSQMGCGIYEAASVSSKTLRLESKASASSATISTEAGTPSVEWTIFSLDHSFPSPILFSANCSVRLDTGNGYGATGTAIRRYTNSTTTGNCITYADNSNSGMSLTINSSGVYTIDWSAKRSASAANIGISVNASSLTTTPDALTVANGNLGYKTITGSSGDFGNISKTKYLNAGDVVRVFANANVANDSLEIVNITKVGD